MTDKTTFTTIKVTSGDRARLNLVMKAQNFKGTQGEFFVYLLDQVGAAKLFSETDLEKLNHAAAVSNMNFESVIVSGALTYADKLIAAGGENKSTPDQKINDFVNALMAKNDTAVEWFDKTEITQGLIASETGCNRANIKNYLAANRARLDDHHAKNEIEPDHNRRVSNHKRKTAV